MCISPSPSAALAPHATKRRGSHRYYPHHHLIRLWKVIESFWERWNTCGRLCARYTKIIFCLKHPCFKKIRYLQYTWYCASKTDYLLFNIFATAPHYTRRGHCILSGHVRSYHHTYMALMFVSTYVGGRSQMTSVPPPLSLPNPRNLPSFGQNVATPSPNSADIIWEWLLVG